MLSKLVTIVIPTYNEEKYIAKTLKAISKQSKIKEIKIIIADANSTDNTIEISKECCKQYKFNLKIVEGGLPAVGRNAGAKYVETPYILFLDADVTFPHKNAIKIALEEIIHSKRDMLSTTPCYRGEVDIRAYIMFRINKYITWFLSKTQPFAIGGFTLIKKQLFEQLGGYDEKATQSEDWLLSRKVNPNNFKLLPDLMTQDNRRFKRYGYWNMIKLLLRNWKNRNNIEYFYQDQNYWK
jgi:glycosyltransferase involved in cell wall biosynthesis